MIVVAHAYSAGNSGDGLLVRLTVERLRRLFPDSGLLVLALDSDSFHLSDVSVAPYPGRSKARGVCGAAASLLTGRRYGLGRIRSYLSSSDLVVGVGGGYLRATSARSAVKMALAHLSQLSLIASTRARTVYLPQSIGPFPTYLRRRVESLLERLDDVVVRDERSFLELAHLANVTRAPDLAVLKIAERGPVQARPGLPTAHLIARELEAPCREYPGNTLALARALGGSQWWVQSEGRGNNDYAFYERLQVEATGRTRDLWADGSQGGVVISVRLHGALESVMNGFPTIHLSYERKGWGAYEDLGIGRYVHNAKQFDVDLVTSQAVDLAVDGSGFFSLVDSRLETLRAQSADLDRLLAGK